MKLIFSVALCLSFFFTRSQSTATIFAPDVISNDGVFGLTLSPKGDHAVWVSSKGKRDTLFIQESKKVNGRWQAPMITSFSGKWRDIDPMFTPDGKTILFQSNRPVEGFPNRKRMDMWAVAKIGNGWGEPYHLGNTINSDSSESYASATKRGTIYFTMENGLKKGDLFYAEFKNGNYLRPVSLSSINTDKRDANPFISPSEEYLIYAKAKADNENDSDLFITFKNENKWTVPQNLGAAVNSSDSEFCPSVHEKQDRLYFSRLRRGEKRFTENVYYVDGFSKILKELKATSKIID